MISQVFPTVWSVPTGNICDGHINAYLKTADKIRPVRLPRGRLTWLNGITYPPSNLSYVSHPQTGNACYSKYDEQNEGSVRMFRHLTRYRISPGRDTLLIRYSTFVATVALLP